MMDIEAVITPVRDITENQLDEMLCLMQRYFVNVTRDQFVSDIKEKDVVIILKEAGTIQGFSSWMLFSHNLDGKIVNVIFSGDTIIERSYWRSLALPLAWGRLMLSAMSECPGELYWLLTTMGYKTYRYLAVFFREFYPSYGRETPAFERALLRSLAQRRADHRFDAGSGIIRASEGSQYLRSGVADISEARRRDEHVAFFEKINPGHVRGDELVCIARCCEGNLNPFILRRLDKLK